MLTVCHRMNMVTVLVVSKVCCSGAIEWPVHKLIVHLLADWKPVKLLQYWADVISWSRCCLSDVLWLLCWLSLYTIYILNCNKVKNGCMNHGVIVTMWLGRIDVTDSRQIGRQQPLCFWYYWSTVYKRRLEDWDICWLGTLFTSWLDADHMICVLYIETASIWVKKMICTDWIE